MSKKKQVTPQKEMTPDEIIISSTAKKLELENELKRLPKYDRFYKPNPEIDDLKAQIAVEQTKIDLARQNKEAELNKSQPHTLIQKTTKNTRTDIKTDIKVNSDNQKTNNWGAQGNKFELNKADKPKATKSSYEPKKKSKAKLIFWLVVIVIVLAGDAALSSYITSCIYKSKDNSSSTYSVQKI